MVSQANRTSLLNLVKKFIDSDDSVTLAHLLDLVSALIPNHDTQEWKDWSKYMDCVNETWVCIHKEGEQVPWPKVTHQASN